MVVEALEKPKVIVISRDLFLTSKNAWGLIRDIILLCIYSWHLFKESCVMITVREAWLYSDTTNNKIVLKPICCLCKM